MKGGIFPYLFGVREKYCLPGVFSRPKSFYFFTRRRENKLFWHQKRPPPPQIPSSKDCFFSFLAAFFYLRSLLDEAINSNFRLFSLTLLSLISAIGRSILSRFLLLFALDIASTGNDSANKKDFYAPFTSFLGISSNFSPLAYIAVRITLK